MRLAKSESEESLGLALQSAYEETLQPFEEFLASEDNTTAFLTANNKDREHCTGVNAICVVCYKDEDDAAMLLCDGCNRGFHTYCLRPALLTIPTCEWFCVQCLRARSGDFGFEDAQEEHCLAGFQELARDFKERHFARFGALSTEAATEREFWKHVQAPPSTAHPDIEVQYGADLHSTIHGSGFPTKETHPLDSYSNCPWNLNNLPILKDSLLRHTSRDVSGMMVPWLYVGMVFSAFCWHTEDHFTYSVNYLHWGETKTWYGVPASDADAFEATMRSQMPDLFEANPDLLFHLTTTLSPAILLDHGVSVTRLDQRPGDIVVTFPRAYHAGFNHGFNLAEAVNFALPDWLPFGRACADLYKEYKKAPVFSHDALVIAAIRERQTSMKDMHQYVFIAINMEAILMLSFYTAFLMT
jgi:histone demethylase JARID1